MMFTALALPPRVMRDGVDQPTYLYDLAANGRIPVVDLDLVNFDRLDPDHSRVGLDAGGP